MPDYQDTRSIHAAQEREQLAAFRTGRIHWRITDVDVPFRCIVLWYLKMAIPALLFVLLSCAICYFTVELIANLQLKAALETESRQLEKTFSAPHATPRLPFH